MYKKHCRIAPATILYLKGVLKDAVWKNVIGSGADFRTWHRDVMVPEFPGGYERAFFVLLPAGGHVHRHKDATCGTTTYHIPVYTNIDCLNNMYPEGQAQRAYWLKVGFAYEVDRSVVHDSYNKGDSDRIHLLLVVNEHE